MGARVFAERDERDLIKEFGRAAASFFAVLDEVGENRGGGMGYFSFGNLGFFSGVPAANVLV